MKTITLAGLQWHAASPSLFHQAGHPVTIAYDGRAWLIAVRGVTGTREFKTRDKAAELVANAFTQAQSATL